ncbi:MAG: hypothetical protein ACRYG2_22505, partial [Janthinobacterium lividum]
MPQPPCTSSATAYRPSQRRRRLVAALITALLGVLVGTTGAAVPAAAQGARAHDRLSLSGYDFETEVLADVVVGSAGNNLVLRLQAGRSLTDGTLVLTLPRPAWRSPLHVGDWLYEGDPATDGSVVVRPRADGTLGPQDCRGTSGAPSVTVLNTEKVHLAIVSHLSCEAGQAVTVRVFGITAPKKAGRYTIPVSVSDAHGQRGPSSLKLRVVRKPTTTLSVDVPDTVHIGTQEPVLVRAVRPDGRLDTAYRGTVGLRAVDDGDCTFRQGGGSPTFTAADAGVKVLSFAVAMDVSHRLEITDVSHRANGARSGRY